MPDFFTVRALAKRLGVTVNQLQTWSVRGLIPWPERTNSGFIFGWDKYQVMEIEEWYMDQLRSPERNDEKDDARADVEVGAQES